MTKVTAAIVGSGNIGTDLMYKLLRSTCSSRAGWSASTPPAKASRLARELGVEASRRGRRLAAGAATSCPTSSSRRPRAYVHVPTRRATLEAGIRAVDLTPAALGPYVSRRSTSTSTSSEMNVNMVTCGGQATIPMVAAVSPGRRRRRTPRSSPPSRRGRPDPAPATNIDEFTTHDRQRRRVLGGAATRQGDHHPQPGRPAADHARHDLLR